MKVKFTQKVMNKKLNKKIGVILSSVTILIGIFSATYYFDKNIDTSADAAYKIDDCLITLGATVEWRTLEFAAFLDIHFESKKNNTYLIPDAINAFIEYKKSVLNAMSKYELGVATNPDQAVQLNNCTNLVEKKIDTAKTMLIEHVTTTSGVKHGQIMIEKYRNINSKLSELNIEIGKIAGALEGFRQKFPGYSKDCLTK